MVVVLVRARWKMGGVIIGAVSRPALLCAAALPGAGFLGAVFLVGGGKGGAELMGGVTEWRALSFLALFYGGGGAN